VDQSDDEKKQHRANRGTNDRRDNARTEMDSELRKYPARNKGPHDSYDEISKKAETGALDDLARKPARDEADNQYDEKTFAGYVHFCFLHDRTAKRWCHRRFSE
jgi:hypothetical protein